ncbi:CobW family GTP-binding protein [Camelimonas abortus]|uniref:CobW family GTP-binding protein n=1 Tax=Camelimonas abortus TaxID=1017184 RepID=A0ABV7LGT3_9HYPH
MSGARIPVLLLTGFLGAGKTSALRRALAAGAFRDAAIVINEAGAAGVDHLLVEKGDEEVTLLEGGCLCCRAQGGLPAALAGLLRRRDAGAAPPFSRVIVETSGLANPAALLASVMAGGPAARRFALAGVTTVVNAAAIREVWERFPEARAQTALADALLVTHGDLMTEAALAGVTAWLRGLNPAASVADARPGRMAPAALWPQAAPAAGAAGCMTARPVADDAGASDFCVRARRFGGWLDPEALDAWLERWTGLLGPALLRVKGVARVRSVPAPVALHVVQGYVHAPQTAPGLPTGAAGCRMALVAAGVDGAILDDALDELEALATPA